MASETLQAVLQAEEAAKESLRKTLEEVERIKADAAKKAKQITADETKKAGQAALTRLNNAKDEAEKIRTRAEKDAANSATVLRVQAKSLFPDAVKSAVQLILAE